MNIDRLINAHPQLKALVENAPQKLDANALESAAINEIGDENFGNAFYRDGLDRLIASANGEADLNPLGRLMLANSIKGFLINRLLMERLRRQNAPELQTTLLPPIIVTGLPRTGTTFLHRLLASDPRHAGIPMWQLTHPIARNAEDTPKKRHDRVDQMLAIRRQLTPELDGTHLIRADAPEEDMHLVAPSFQSRIFWNIAPVYSYQDWLLSHDKTDKYREFVDYLRVVQATRPNTRLVLKAPDHVDGMTELMTALPDAMIIQTHRDIAKQFGSYLSLGRTTRKIAVNTLDTHREVEMIFKMADISIERSTQAHSDHPGRILDIKYDELVSDPRAIAQHVYGHFGLSLDTDANEALAQYERRNPKGKHGEHNYSLDEFGVDINAVYARYADYTARFVTP